MLISAKISEVNEITPVSNYVTILNDGHCYWEPRFDLSVTHCDVDVTWFPFDAQRCQLVFESWILNSDELNVTSHEATEIMAFTYYVPSDEWTIQCA